MYEHSSNFATYWSTDAREQLLSDFASIAFASGTATAEVWRDEIANAGGFAGTDVPPLFPFHHPTSTAVIELLTDVLHDWITKSVPKAVASLEYVLNMHPANGAMVVLGSSSSGVKHRGDDVIN